MLVVDSHVHLGGSKVTETMLSEADLISNMEKWKVDVDLVLPLPHALPSPEEVRDRIHRLAQENPGKFYGVIDIDPRLSEEAYWEEARHCLVDLGFVGIKLHTFLQPCDPISSSADKVFEAAKHFKVPVIVHTGLGSPFSLPSLLILRARQFPEVPIVLAHAGANYYTAEATVAAQVCDNIFLEPSWCGAHRVKDAIKKVGSEKVMFSSDLPINLPVELAKFHNMGLTDAQLEDCLGLTAARVFRLPIGDRASQAPSA